MRAGAPQRAAELRAARRWARRAAALAAAASLSACSAGADHGAPEPLEPSGATAAAAGPELPPPDAGAAATSTPAPDATANGPDAPDTSTGATRSTSAPTRDDDWRELVDTVLVRYGRALTDLAVDPVARTAPGTPQRRAWDATVVHGSWLWADMPAQLVRRQREDRVVVLPPAGGLSYRHRALLVEPPVQGAVSFTWCGWSPGIGVDPDDGEVVDDEVAHARGTGQIREVDGTWMLEALDQLDLELLGPGAADPCPAEVAALLAGGRDGAGR